MTQRKLFLPLLALLIFPFVSVLGATGTVSVDYGNLYEISYDAKDVTIADVTPNSDEVELIFSIHVDSPAASITLTIPRELLDAKEGGEDTSFFVIANDEIVNFSEKKSTETTRTLFIQLSQGMAELEIFGTYLAGKTFENTPTEENQTPQAAPENSPAKEETPEQQSAPPEEKPAESLTEKPTQTTTENNPVVMPAMPSMSFPTWSIQINERQMTEFVMVAGVFIGLLIVLASLKSSRTAKSLP